MVHLCCFKHVSREQRVPCGNFLLNRRPPLCELDWSCGTGCLEDSELQITTGASEAQRGLLPQRLGGGWVWGRCCTGFGLSTCPASVWESVPLGDFMRLPPYASLPKHFKH